jgi:hypothetical protein
MNIQNWIPASTGFDFPPSTLKRRRRKPAVKRLPVPVPQIVNLDAIRNQMAAKNVSRGRM